MSDKQTFRLIHDTARRGAIEAIKGAPVGYHVTIRPPTRSLDANARMWAMLADVAAQVAWHGRKLSSEDWKIVFTASLKQMVVVPNLENTGFVALGQSTSRMSVREMYDLQTLIEAFGAWHEVKFSE